MTAMMMRMRMRRRAGNNRQQAPPGRTTGQSAVYRPLPLSHLSANLRHEGAETGTPGECGAQIKVHLQSVGKTRIETTLIHSRRQAVRSDAGQQPHGSSKASHSGHCGRGAGGLLPAPLSRPQGLIRGNRSGLPPTPRRVSARKVPLGSRSFLNSPQDVHTRKKKYI